MSPLRPERPCTSAIRLLLMSSVWSVCSDCSPEPTLATMLS